MGPDGGVSVIVGWAWAGYAAGRDAKVRRISVTTSGFSRFMSLVQAPRCLTNMVMASLCHFGAIMRFRSKPVLL